MEEARLALEGYVDESIDSCEGQMFWLLSAVVALIDRRKPGPKQTTA